jgi:hypothetical protein
MAKEQENKTAGPACSVPKGGEELSQLHDLLLYENGGDLPQVAKALMCVDYLMEFQGDGVNGEVEGVICSGLSRIIRKCALELERICRFEQEKEKSNEEKTEGRESTRVRSCARKTAARRFL